MSIDAAGAGLTPAPDLDAAAARPGLLRQVMRNPVALTCLVVFGLLVLIGLIGPYLAPYDPARTALDNVLAPPNAEHLLGGDSAGRDIFSRLLYATRFSLLGMTIALITAMVTGVVTGLFAGYYGGWFDEVATWVATMVMSLPGIIILLAARAAIGPSIWWSMFIFGFILAPGFFRIVQNTVRSVREELYVDAARVAGLSDIRIIFRHVLVSVRPPVIIQAAVMGVMAIAMQAGLEFLGLGDMSIPTWGSMLNDAYAKMNLTSLPLLWPGLMIALTSASLVLFSIALRDIMQHRKPARKQRVRTPGAKANTAAAARSEATVETTSEANVPLDATVPTSEASVPLDATVPTSSLLAVRDLVIAYPGPGGEPRRVVDGVTFDLGAGRVLGLVGESGSGKTQTVLSVLGLLPGAASRLGGDIWYQDTLLDSERTMRELGIRGREIGYVPQEPMSNLDPALTIGQQMVAPLRRNLGMTRQSARLRSLELLEKVGIHEPERVLASYPHQLSGGMAQRVLIAGAISCSPKLLVADEPTSSLDVTVQAEVLELLRTLQEETGMGVLMVTHNFGVVSDICTDVVVMRHGVIVEEGPVETVLTAPQHPYTQSLLAATLYDKEPFTRLRIGEGVA